MSRKGADLALLLLGGFRHLADAARKELSRRGYPELRPGQEFAMRAIAAGATNASELARRLSITKQAAAKTITILEQRGYVTRTDDEADSRRKLLVVTPKGFEVMREGEAIFDELRAAWGRKIGDTSLEQLEQALTSLLDGKPIDPDQLGIEDLDDT